MSSNVVSPEPGTWKVSAVVHPAIRRRGSRDSKAQVGRWRCVDRERAEVFEVMTFLCGENRCGGLQCFFRNGGAGVEARAARSKASGVLRRSAPGSAHWHRA